MSTPRLLVIDHDLAVQQTLEAAFASEGFEVTLVRDGLTALDVALATRPDVILADYRMDGTNIFRFFEKLKHKNILKSTALLLMVNPGDEYDELTLRLVGVTDFIRKPLSGQETLDRVKRYLPVPIAAPASPLPSSPPPIPAEPDAVKIEDLLGWSHPPGESPFSELSQDRSGGLNLESAEAAPPEAMDEATQFLERNEITPTDHLADAALEQTFMAPPSEDPFAAPTPSPPPPAPPKAFARFDKPAGVSPPVVGNGGPSQQELVDRLAKEIVEKIAWDVVPGLAQQSLDQVIQSVVERIVWEAVPAIAETAVKQEIERLKNER